MRAHEYDATLICTRLGCPTSRQKLNYSFKIKYSAMALATTCASPVRDFSVSIQLEPTLCERHGMGNSRGRQKACVLICPGVNRKVYDPESAFRTGMGGAVAGPEIFAFKKALDNSD